MKIIVTVPAYNEQDTIGKVVDEIKGVMESNSYSYAVLVVDDGSKDGTAEIAKEHGAAVFSHPKNYGLAETFRTEVKKCLEMGADIIVHIDADTQYKAAEIPKLVKEIENGYDLVLGSRFRGRIESMPLVKRIGNIAFSRAISRITGLKISDAQTGFRAFTMDIAKKIQISSNHTYTQEQIIRAVREKFRIKEVPIYFAKRLDKSRLISNPFGYAVRAWINIIRIYRDYEPLKFFGTVGSAIFGFGVAIGLFLVYRHITIGLSGRHFGLMMLDVIILSLGFQILIFGFIADMMRK